MNVKQTTTLDNTKITTIDLGYMMREQGKKLAAKLNGKTYMDFEIIVAPAGGECAITAQSYYNGEADEILGMFLFLMASELAN